ncbi:MAG: hypothetical protein ACRDQW_01955, partial [Haloechinothrix sp.]
GQVFETIRQGARWDVFVRNLRVAAECLDLVLDVAVQRDNVSDIANLIAFARAEGVAIRLENTVCYPEELCIRNLPLRRRSTVADEFERLATRCEGLGENDTASQLRSLIAFMTVGTGESYDS